MAKALQELCYELIQSTYGELCAQIFRSLAAHGRSTVVQISELSGLRPRQVRHGLTVLLEHHVVQRFVSDERSTAVYQVSYRNAYNIARHDSAIRFVHDRWGEDAALLTECVLDVGHARVGDVIESARTQLERREGARDAGRDHVNGSQQETGKIPKGNTARLSVGYWHSIMRTLLHANVLSKAGARSYIPYHDLQDELEETVINNEFPDGKVNGPKKRIEFMASMQRLKRQWQSEDEYSDQRDLESAGSRPSNKRVRLMGSANGVTSHYQDDGMRVSADLIIRVNHVRCVMAMRSRRLQKLAERYLGETTAAVYGALLRVLENDRSGDDADAGVHGRFADDKTAQSRTATTAQISEQLDVRIELASAIRGLGGPKQSKSGNGLNGFGNGNYANGHSTSGQEISDDDHDDEHDDEMNGVSELRLRSNRLSHIEAHLCVLEEHSKQFCHRDQTYGGGRGAWQVDDARLNKALVEAEIDEIVLSRHGDMHLRIVHLLREKGKLDEKQIASMAIQPAKDVYVYLTCLQFEGILAGQEVPKDSSRQPNKSLYLWYIEDGRVQDLLLQKTYKVMTRHLQRVYVERKRHRTILDKASRSDVKGREQEKLSGGEKQVLRQLRENEERLLTQITRLDELVGVLRDYDGGDESLNR